LAEVVSFLSEHSGGSSCVQVDLGCNGYKLSCTFGEASSNPDKQLHYVVAPRLLSSAVDGDEYGVDGWTEKIMESFGDMTTFSPFMHEKAQVFVNDIVAKLEVCAYPRAACVINKNNKITITSHFATSHPLRSFVSSVFFRSPSRRRGTR
jgi:hypothetical protein